jgi:hypothetical protein
MPIHVTAERELLIGTKTIVEAPAPNGYFVAVFEDDENTGYFYALDSSAIGNPIQDGLHIYNVVSVADRSKPSIVRIGWSNDSKKVVLLINGYPHAVFDFEAKQGYCRTGFPPPAFPSGWSAQGHQWTEAAIQLFA